MTSTSQVCYNHTQILSFSLRPSVCDDSLSYVSLPRTGRLTQLWDVPGKVDWYSCHPVYLRDKNKGFPCSRFAICQRYESDSSLRIRSSEDVSSVSGGITGEVVLFVFQLKRYHFLFAIVHLTWFALLLTGFLIRLNKNLNRKTVNQISYR